MKTPLPSRAAALACALGVCAIVPASATIIIDETFADGNRTTQNPPDSLAWYSSQDPANITTAVGSMALSGGGGTGAQSAMAYFPSVSLNVGQTLTLSMNFMPTGTLGTAATLNAIRFGIFNSNGGTVISADGQNPSMAANTYVGYVGRMNLSQAGGTTTTNVLERGANAGTLLTTSGAYTTNLGTAGSIVDSLTLDTAYALTLTLNRTAASSMTITFSLSGGDLIGSAIASYTDTTGIVTSFDSLGFSYFGNSGTGFSSASFSNIQMEVVPEPSTAALALVGMLGVAGMARRRLSQFRR